MTRHIVDHKRESQGTERVKAYVALERKQTLHPAIQALRSRTENRPEAGRRMVEFLRIARGRQV